MPRTYKPLKVKRDPVKLQLAILAIENGSTVKQASKEFSVPAPTIYANLRSKLKKNGGPTVFSEGEEESLVTHLRAVADLGMPIDAFELRLIIKQYLERIGHVVPRFRDNIPGKGMKIVLKACETPSGGSTGLHLKQKRLFEACEAPVGVSQASNVTIKISNGDQLSILGPDWASGILKRHKDSLSVRISQNMSGPS